MKINVICTVPWFFSNSTLQLLRMIYRNNLFITSDLLGTELDLYLIPICDTRREIGNKFVLVMNIENQVYCITLGKGYSKKEVTNPGLRTYIYIYIYIVYIYIYIYICRGSQREFNEPTPEFIGRCFIPISSKAIEFHRHKYKAWCYAAICITHTLRARARHSYYI